MLDKMVEQKTLFRGIWLKAAFRKVCQSEKSVHMHPLKVLPSDFSGTFRFGWHRINRFVLYFQKIQVIMPSFGFLITLPGITVFK